MVREGVASKLLASVQTIPFATALYVAKEFLRSGCSSDAESHVYVRFNDDSSLTMCVIIENDKYCDDLDDENSCDSSDSWLYLELKNVCKIYEQSTLYYTDNRFTLLTVMAEFVDRITEIYGYKGSYSGLSYLISDKIKDSVSNVLIYNADDLSIVVSNGVNHVVASSPYEIAKYNVINRDELFDVAKEYRYIVRYLSDDFKLYISQKDASKWIFTDRVNNVREAISHMYDLPSLPDGATKNDNFFITYSLKKKN